MSKIKISFSVTGATLVGTDELGTLKSFKVLRNDEGQIVEIDLEWKGKEVKGCGGNCSCGDKKVSKNEDGNKKQKVIPAEKAKKIDDIPFEDIYNNVLFGDGSLLAMIESEDKRAELQLKFANKMLSEMVGVGCGPTGMPEKIPMPPMFKIIGMDIG